MTLHLFLFFHLNLAFSSIEEEVRPEVIRRCYWPLLRLVRSQRLPTGIEISGYTLEVIASIDPLWVEELKNLCDEGLVEFIGSGYAQMIGPLVPASVNQANQRFGLQVYEHLLGFRPRLVLVNEQAYSAGLLGHYLDAGYEGMIMEWDNPSRFSSGWSSQWRYLPQVAVGPAEEKLPIIWNHSIIFQQFQRYVHGELELHEYLNILEHQDPGPVGAIPFYGNDVEIFDFRPGRFTTEAMIEHDEWSRIQELIQQLRTDDRFIFIPPSKVLSFSVPKDAGNFLRLESAQAPIPVKKQEKYNITRWAVTGRNDTLINTLCQRIYRKLVESKETSEKHWKELCYLWSSDFRTHITGKRWRKYRRRLAAAVNRADVKEPAELYRGDRTICPPGVKVQRQGKFLEIETTEMKVRLNLRRGLTLDSLYFPSISPHSLCGTLYHGYFDDIASGADFYTGHFVFETPGRPKITDLVPIEPEISWQTQPEIITVTGNVRTPLGKVEKLISLDIRQQKVVIDYIFHWPTMPIGSLRLGHVTINPEAFDRSDIYYRCHNGGSQAESFRVKGEHIQHGEASSFLVSAKHGLGMTEGWVELGDADKKLRIEVDHTVANLLGLITYKNVAESYFYRCSLSASEMDETSKARRLTEPFRARIAISGVR